MHWFTKRRPLPVPAGPPRPQELEAQLLAWRRLRGIRRVGDPELQAEIRRNDALWAGRR